jgi:hypothetical protein
MFNIRKHPLEFASEGSAFPVTRAIYSEGEIDLLVVVGWQ